MNRWMTWVAVAPTVLGGTMLWLAVLALLPSAASGIAACVVASVASWLFIGRGEERAVVLLALGRRLSSTEGDLLAASQDLLARRDIAIGHIYVRREIGGGLAVQPVGRQSLLVSPGLLEGLAAGSVDRKRLAVVLAHAEAQRAVSLGMRHDISARFLASPWQLIRAVLRRWGYLVGWVPGRRLIPPIALMLVSTAAVMTIVAGLWWLGAVLISALGLQITAPWARQYLARRLHQEADELLVAQGFGTDLLVVLRSQPCDDNGRANHVETLVHGIRPELRIVAPRTEQPKAACVGPADHHKRAPASTPIHLVLSRSDRERPSPIGGARSGN